LSKKNCIHLGYACGEDFCLISKGNSYPNGEAYSFKQNLCKDCQSYISNEAIICLYFRIRNEIIDKGFREEIHWFRQIPSLENLTRLFFFREYVWVVISSGMKNQVAEKIFKEFWIDDSTFNFEAIKHPNKNKAIKKVYNRLDFYFNQFLKSKNKLKFLESLPHIGNITKYHLAKNLGLNVAKPDRHLVRIANQFEYNDVQKFCKKLSQLTNEKIGVVDVVLWRFANLNKNYLKLIENWKKEEKEKIGPVKLETLIR